MVPRNIINVPFLAVSDCDRSCNGCDGDGPDNCFACAKGYFMNDNMCQGKSD